MKKYIPAALIWFRLIVSAVIPVLTVILKQQANMILLILLITGFLSDILDGVAARLIGVSTTSLRRIDSIVDRIFWLAMLFSLVVLWPAFFKSKLPGIAIVLGIEVVKYLASFIRFHRELSAHAMLSKAFGVCIMAAFIEVLVRNGESWFFDIMLIVGIVSRIDSVLIVFFLPKWEHDIPSCYHAWQIRKGSPIRRSWFLNG